VIRRPRKGRGAFEALGTSPGAGAAALAQELAGCRQVLALEGATDYQGAAMVKGIDGVVRLVLGGGASRPALLAVCGATAKAGTTAVAMAVALHLAEAAHKRVMLVDADFRSPALGRLLGGASIPDFASVLAGQARLAEAAVRVEAEKLFVLPLAGAASSETALHEVSRALEGPAMGRLLDAARGCFDAVIFDAGSVGGWSGAAELAGVVGTAVLVVRSGRTGAGEARAARRTLEHFGARVAGAVLTFAAAQE
jgi:Mrp family chromosome partitioning ATPase